MARPPQFENRGNNRRSEIEEFKGSLGPIAGRYSDNELSQLHRDMSTMAELLLDFYTSGKQKREGVDRRRPGGTLKAERSTNELSFG